MISVSRSFTTDFARTALAGGFLAVTLSIASAQVSTPVAIVESASPEALVDTFEYLKQGQQIDLSSGGSIVIGYLASCRLETISGGRITVGTRQSDVDGGEISAEKVNCDGGQIELTQEAAATSGVVVYRAPDAPHLTLYSATPAFVFPAGSQNNALEIVRLDRKEQSRQFPLDDDRIDLSSLNAHLNPGGTYEARSGDQRQTFRIVVYGRPGGPLVSRLVRF